MIAGCYTLDLYCQHFMKVRDILDDKTHVYGEFPHQYTDERGSVCRQMARSEGWKLNLKTGEALCPKCNPDSPTFHKD